MFSVSVARSSGLLEDQFLSDLMSLYARHKIRHGGLQDLEHLGSDLESNGAFRSALFTLCTAFSHMNETDLTSEQLLALVGRALGGPGSANDKGEVEFPLECRAAFLTGYEAWINRDTDLDRFAGSSPGSEDEDAWQAPVTPFYTAAAIGKGEPDLEQEESPPDGATRAPAPGPRRVFPPDTRLESLTLKELRLYLEDLEQRVGRAEPNAGQTAGQKDASPRRARPSVEQSQTGRATEQAKATAPKRATASKPSSAGGVLTVPSALMMPYAVFTPKPVYPKTKRDGLDSSVLVQATISKEGKVTSARALSGAADVRPAAIQAMQEWRFKPYVVNGQAMEVVTTVKFVFKAE